MVTLWITNYYYLIELSGLITTYKITIFLLFLNVIVIEGVLKSVEVIAEVIT